MIAPTHMQGKCDTCCLSNHNGPIITSSHMLCVATGQEGEHNTTRFKTRRAPANRKQSVTVDHFLAGRGGWTSWNFQPAINFSAVSHVVRLTAADDLRPHVFHSSNVGTTDWLTDCTVTVTVRPSTELHNSKLKHNEAAASRRDVHGGDTVSKQWVLFKKYYQVTNRVEFTTTDFLGTRWVDTVGLYWRVLHQKLTKGSHLALGSC